MYLTINYILLLLSPSRLASRSSQKLAELLHVPLAAAAVAAAVMHLTFAVDTRHSIFFFFSFFFQIFFPPSLSSSFDMCLARGLTGDWKALSPWSRRAKEREQTCRQTDRHIYSCSPPLSMEWRLVLHFFRHSTCMACLLTSKGPR